MATAKKAAAKKVAVKRPAAKKTAPAKAAARPLTKRAPTKAAPAKKAPAAKKAVAKAARKPNAAFMKALTPSAALAAVIGDKAMPRTEVTKKIWDYIKKNGLQDSAKKTMINADEKLRAIFKKAQVSMFEMTKLVSDHLK